MSHLTNPARPATPDESIALQRALHWMGIQASAAGVLTLLPMVHVAWADGQVQPEERDLILRIARDRVVMDSASQELLNGWLSFRPSNAYLTHGRHVLVGLSGCDWGPRVSKASISDIVQICLDVARAAGGIFGLRAVVPGEREALAEVERLVYMDPEDSLLLLRHIDYDSEAEDPTGSGGQIRSVQPTVVCPSQAPVGPQTACILHHTRSGPVAFALRLSRVQIGRARDNDVQILHDQTVSRRHCALEHGPDGWTLRDLASSTGTLVNGERVISRRLLGGEVLRFGDTTFVFHPNGAPLDLPGHMQSQATAKPGPPRKQT